MKKALLLLIFVIISNSLFSQVNYLPVNDTIVTKVNCYALDVNMTDIGLLHSISMDNALDNKYATIINSGKKLKAIGLGHISGKTYYDSYVINYKNRLYYIHTNVVLNINDTKRDYYNSINKKIYQDSVNLVKNAEALRERKIIEDNKIAYELNLMFIKNTENAKKIKIEKQKNDSICRDSIVRDSIKQYHRWYNNLTIKQKIAYNTINISDCYIDINSACGVSPTINYTNLSNKTIKYFRWYGYVKNNVNDIVYCTISGNTNASGRSTGPIKKGETDFCEWGCCWYNCDATKFIVNKIEITYLDKSVVILDKSQIYFLFNINKTKLNKYDF